MHHLTTCPVCGGEQFRLLLTAIDHTVSHETFDVIKCERCSIAITTPQPDAAQIPKYYQSSSYISHSNSKTNPFDIVYQITRQFTLSWKLRIINNRLKINEVQKIRLLDYGCGTGHFLLTAQKAGFQITGVEPSDTARKIAEEKTTQKIKTSIPELTDTFDVITLWHVIEHVSDLNETIEMLKDRLDKNGTMFIAVPNHESNDSYYYKEYWAGYDVPRHLWHFNQRSMQTLMTKHQLKIQEIIPMKLDAFYVSMLSEKYQHGKQTLLGNLQGFIRGLTSNLKATNNNYSSQIFVVTK